MNEILISIQIVRPALAGLNYGANKEGTKLQVAIHNTVAQFSAEMNEILISIQIVRPALAGLNYGANSLMGLQI